MLFFLRKKIKGNKTCYLIVNASFLTQKASCIYQLSQRALNLLLRCLALSFIDISRKGKLDGKHH